MSDFFFIIRFKVEWLNRTPLGVGERDYSDLGNIETDHDDRVLSDDAYAVLKGVHESGGLNTAKTPSDEDISFLKQCYDGRCIQLITVHEVSIMTCKCTFIFHKVLS